MPKSPEQFNMYSEEKALNEARRMQEKIAKGEAHDYNEAEVQIEAETSKKEILENRPRDNEIEDPKTADLPETPQPTKWKDSATGEILTSYPAICHDLRSSGGRMVDRWIIKWFDNPDDAKSVDLEARKEADSYIKARRIYAELTKEVTEGELPFKIPERWNELSPQKILGMAGFSEDQYQIRNDVGHWYELGEAGYRSEGESWDGTSPSATLAQKNKEGIWEIGARGLSNIFEDQSVYAGGPPGGPRYVGRVGGWVNAKSVLSEMGVPDEKIISIKTQIETEKKKAEEEFNADQKKFVEGLKNLPAFSCLPQNIQEKIDKLGDGYYVGDIPLLAEELRKEWGIAEKLQNLKEQGEILVNWGGHFRRMGSTGQRDFWVVCPDGTLRNSEDIRYHGRYTSQGDKHWRVVAPDELALTYYSTDSGDKNHCEVIKLPANGISPAQIERAHIIEYELRANINAFGLDSEIMQKEKVRLEAIKRAYDGLPDDLRAKDGGWNENWSFQDVMSSVDVRPYDESNQKREKFIDRIDRASINYDTSAMGKRRGRQIIHSEPCADGIIEMTAYEKWGGWNLSMSWREFSEDEKNEQENKTTKTFDDSLLGLANKFGGNKSKKKSK